MLQRKKKHRFKYSIQRINSFEKDLGPVLTEDVEPPSEVVQICTTSDGGAQSAESNEKSYFRFFIILVFE